MENQNCSVVILSTKTCIKCKSLIPLLSEELDNLRIQYEVLDALYSGRHLVDQFNIISVPTVLIYKDLENDPTIVTGNFTVSDIIEKIKSID